MAGAKTHAVTDALGSVYGLTNTTGAAVTRYNYDAFGARTAGVEAEPTSWGFTGRRGDPTGLQYNRIRYLENGTGRWASPDPLGFVDGPNRYGYVLNDPVSQRDPTGQLVELQCRALDSKFGEWGGSHCAVRVRFNCEADGRGPHDLEIPDTLIEADEMTVGGRVLSAGAEAPAALLGFGKPKVNFYPWTGPMSGSAGTAKRFAPFAKDWLMTLPGRLPGEREKEIMFRAQAAAISPPTYNPWGPNSNTLVKELLRGLFYTPGPPSGAVGWDSTWWIR